jgi:hypothetical protein
MVFGGSGVDFAGAGRLLPAEAGVPLLRAERVRLCLSFDSLKLRRLALACILTTAAVE